jgi:hypothetical protein
MRVRYQTRHNFEIAVDGEIVQMKQDRIVPIYRCQVIEMIVF